MDIHTSSLDFVGHTPLLELKNIFTPSSSLILAKMENQNPTSIKDRAVISMVQKALEEGLIQKNTEVVEASSGNTAISIASLGAVFGYKTRIFMSDLCSEERIKILNAYGAKVILTPGLEHTKGARERAEAYCKANPQTSFFLNQHSNINNGRAHYTTTGPEIWEQTEGKVNTVIMGLGTSGTFDGLSRFFKEKNPAINIVGFEPEQSPVYSGGVQSKHNIIGIGPGFITDNFKRSQEFLDELILVSDKTSFDWARKIAKQEGILVGPTSGAGAYVANFLAQRPDYENKIIVFLVCDTGERYLSTPGLFEINDVERIP